MASDARSEEDSVVICMTTYNPVAELLGRQVETLRAQTHRNWTCTVCDDASDPERLADLRAVVGSDPRFTIVQSAVNVGFYRNFERALIEGQKTGSKYVALCDQDDAWHSDKLARLIGAMRPEIGLVYADVRIVDSQLNVLQDTYWVGRKNNYEDLTLLFFANTVTGAASLFQSSLLRYILPFPKPIGAAFHDHWIALIARAMAEIEYLSVPLSDYVQHEAHVIGHATRTAGRRMSFVRMRDLPGDLERVYQRDLLRIQSFARELQQRTKGNLQPQQVKAVRVLSRLDSASAVPWLARRTLMSIWTDSVTMGAERRLLAALLWQLVRRSPLGGA
jgi:hypothetical protein